MKFNFEKIKKAVEIAGVAAITTIPLADSHTDTISSESINPHAISQTVTSTNIPNPAKSEQFKFPKSTSEKVMDPLLDKIYNLEKKLSNINHTENTVIPKSFTIIGSVELEDGSKILDTQLNDRYIADELLVATLNLSEGSNNLKIIPRDVLSLAGIKDAEVLHQEGYIDFDHNIKNPKPEYYFIVTREDQADFSNFTLKIVSPVTNKIETISSLEMANNEVSLENENIMKNKIIPEFLAKIQEKIQALGLNNK